MVVALGFGLLVMVSYFDTKHSLIEVTNEKQLAAIEGVSESIHQWIENKQRIISSAALVMSGVFPQDAATLEKIAKQSSRSGDFPTYTVAYEDGNMPVVLGWTPTQGYDPRTRPWYKLPKKEGKTVVTKPYLYAGDGKIYLSIASPIKNNGQFKGVMTGD